MDKVLKRRLIGASILIALAVIFVPMLLVDPDAVDDDGARDRVDVPPMPESARDVRRIPLNPEAPGDDAGRDRAARTADARPAREAEEARPRPVPEDEIVLRPELEPDAPADDGDVDAAAEEEPAPAEPVVAETESTPEPEPAPEAAAEADSEPEPEPESGPEPVAATGETGRDAVEAVSMGDWAVQVASFGSDAAASRVRNRLEALGHIVQRDEIVRGQTMLYRLRTGPYPSRDAAQTALEQIEATVEGVDPIVRALSDVDGTGDEAGFAVQVGSFVSQDNAESETARLAGLGFDAFRFSEQIGERTIWRVLVGPVAERAEAEDLQSRLVDEAGVEGLVVSQP
jgi:DedD protein